MSDTVYDNLVALRFIKVPLDLEGLCSYWSKSESSVGCSELGLRRGVSLADQQQWPNQSWRLTMTITPSIYIRKDPRINHVRSLPSTIRHKCEVCWRLQSKLSLRCEVDSSAKPRSIVLHPQHVTRDLYKCFWGLYRTTKRGQLINSHK